MKESKGFDLIDKNGYRKYLNMSERALFKNVIEKSGSKERLFGLMLYWTGARISEILNLTTSHIDLDKELVIIKCLKKRTLRPIWRRIPLPTTYIHELDQFFSIRESANSEKLWSWSRSTASRRISEFMKLAGISGKHANPRGCRHSFGLFCAKNHIPASVLKQWMGHSHISTTIIYMDFTIEDQRDFAEKLWD